jgi:hypothetical protein
MIEQDPALRTVYVTIGNSDNKLTQEEWAFFCAEVYQRVSTLSTKILGAWYSLPHLAHQNACWGMHLEEPMYEKLRLDLARCCRNWNQDAIAFATAQVELIRPEGS